MAGFCDHGYEFCVPEKHRTLFLEHAHKVNTFKAKGEGSRYVTVLRSSVWNSGKILVSVFLQMPLVCRLMVAKIMINKIPTLKWTQHIPLKHLHLSTRLRNITSQNTILVTLHYIN